MVLCCAKCGNWLLCQITSNPHSDPNTVTITSAKLVTGTLSSLSFARPTKLFTGNETLIAKRNAILADAPFSEIILTIFRALQEVVPTEGNTEDGLPPHRMTISAR